MKHTFVAEISVQVEISQEDFLFICLCCKNHYDHTVAQTVEVGGFMYGISGRREWILSKGGELPLEHLTFRKIDLLCKALEVPSVDLLRSVRITAQFHRILMAINEKTQVVNNWLANGITEEDVAECHKSKNAS